MDLYRIILVDDEEEVRKSIIRKIDWQSVGFTVVGDAENGEDALEKIENLEPDVVLTISGCRIWMVLRLRRRSARNIRR